nr:MAG TPA: SITE SPECIFIC RECOMBINASE XERD [Caudoviricetes sp.]
MNVSEKIMNSIVMSMSTHLEPAALSILKDVLIKNLSHYTITECETLPATADDSNEYILKLFAATKATKLSAKTVSYYVDTIKRLLSVIHKPLIEITSIDISYFLNSLRSSNDSVSLNNLRRNISAFYTWMRKSHLIVENPCEAVEPYTEIEKPIDHLEPTEYEQLKSGCSSTRDRALIEFLRSTAMRVGEVGAVKISDINWNTGLISIYGKKSHAYRPVCLDTIALKYLTEYITERKLHATSTVPLFTIHHSDDVLSAEGIRESIKSIKQRSGLKRRVYPHLFRKTTATNIIKRGGSVHDAGEYLGHKDSSTAGKHYSFIGSEHTIDIFRRYVQSV